MSDCSFQQSWHNLLREGVEPNPGPAWVDIMNKVLTKHFGTAQPKQEPDGWKEFNNELTKISALLPKIFGKPNPEKLWDEHISWAHVDPYVLTLCREEVPNPQIQTAQGTAVAAPSTVPQEVEMLRKQLEELKLKKENELTPTDYLKQKLASPHSPPKLIAGLGAELVLQNRTKAIMSLKERFESYIKLTAPRDKAQCWISILAGSPGIGKTRLLSSLPEFAPFDSTCYFIVTYNQGFSPTPFDRDHPEAALVLRLLYFNFESDVVRKEDFSSYVNKAKEVIGEKIQELRLTTALSLLTGQQPFVLAIDEFNQLLSVTRNTLKSIVNTLGDAMVKSDTPFFPILAGTALVPLSDIITESCFPHKSIPFCLLSLDAMQDICESLRWLPTDWKTSRAFQRTLLSVGGLPRLLEFFFLACKKRVDEKLSMEFWPWIEILQEVKSNLSQQLNDVAQTYGRALVVDTILYRTVGRNVTVLGFPFEGATYGELERKGMISLAQDNEGNLHVELPPIVLHLFLVSETKALPNEVPELTTVWLETQTLLRSLFLEGNDTVTLLPCLDWQSFEHFLATYETIRTSLLYYSCKLQHYPTTCTVSRFFKSVTCHPTTEASLEKMTLSLELRKRVHLKHTFPPGESRVLNVPFPTLQFYETGSEVPEADYHRYVFTTVDGGVADTFSYRELSNSKGSKDLLFIGQSKHVRDINQELVRNEAKKAEEAINSKLPYLLIIFSTSPCPFGDTELKKMPQKCIFIGGDQIRSYLGQTLADQARIFIRTSSKLVNINIATKDELQLTLLRIGTKRAENIIRWRAEKEFENWDDFLQRFKDAGDITIPKANQELIKYCM